MAGPMTLAERNEQAEHEKRLVAQQAKYDAPQDENGGERIHEVEVQAVSRETGDPNTTYRGFGQIGRYFESDKNYVFMCSDEELAKLKEARAFLMVRVNRTLNKFEMKPSKVQVAPSSKKVPKE